MEVYQSGIIFTELCFALEQYAAYVITGHFIPVPVPVGVKHQVFRLGRGMIAFTITTVLFPDFFRQRGYPVLFALAVEMYISLAA